MNIAKKKMMEAWANFKKRAFFSKAKILKVNYSV